MPLRSFRQKNWNGAYMDDIWESPTGILEFQAGGKLQSSSLLTRNGTAEEFIGDSRTGADGVALIAGAGTVLDAVFLIGNKIAVLVTVIVQVAAKRDFHDGLPDGTHTRDSSGLVKNLPTAHIEEAVVLESELDSAFVADTDAEIIAAHAVGERRHLDAGAHLVDSINRFVGNSPGGSLIGRLGIVEIKLRETEHTVVTVHVGCAR